ncbi:MAG: hypothetical protein ACYTFW_15695 [Planctomycetota bacterium]|jgi:hypothetical protein
MNVNIVIVPVVSSVSTWFVPLIASLIGGGMVLLGVRYTHRLDLKKQKREEEKALQNLYKSLFVEFSAFWHWYQEGPGRTLESLEEGEPLLAHVAITQEYFSIYKGNSILIGRIRDDELREILVKTYIQIQALIDAYQIYGDFLEKHQESRGGSRTARTADGKDNEADKLRARTGSLMAVGYSVALRQKHDIVKQNVQRLTELLEKNIMST